MSAQLATQAVLLLLANLPSAVDTAEKVFAFVTSGIASITEAVGDATVTNDELLALVKKAVDQHVAIQAIP